MSEKKSEELDLLEDFILRTENNIKALEAENKEEGRSDIRITINNAMLIAYRSDLVYLRGMAEVRGIKLTDKKPLPF